MAFQYVFVNVTIDPAAVNKPDRADHVHIVTRGVTAANDLTVSFDPTRVMTLNRLRSAFDEIIKAAKAGTELT